MTKQEQHMKEMQGVADKNAKYLKLAFLAAVMELRNNLVDVEALSKALESGSIEDINRAIHIDDLENLLYGIGMNKDGFIFSDEVRTIFNVGALASFFTLSDEKQKAWNYNPIGERATAFLHEYAAETARQLVTNTKAGLQAIVSRVTAENFNVETQVKEIRQLIGLTADQAQAVLNFRRQLETRQILGFTPPDERKFDVLEQTVIRNHMKNNTMTPKAIDGMVEKYYENLINKRALDIANTTAMNAVNNGQQEMWSQGLDAGVFSDDTDRKFWVTAGDEKVRATHRVIPGMNPGGVKINSMFVTPFGLVIGPGTSNSGFINCRCVAVVLPVGSMIL
jgi:hypothetical protein